MALGTEIRYALRSHARSPILTATLVLTVAVGAGSNAAIFGFIGGLIRRSAAGTDPDDAARFTSVAVLLLCACALVLLIACATVAGLLLSRASARMLETAVKIAIGATRGRLARQCLVDSLIVTIAGGALGVLFAWWTSHLVPMLFFAADADALALEPNRVWLAAAAAVWIVVMALCGMVPIVSVPQRDPAFVLRRDAAKASNSSRRFRVQLVVTQIALCSVLVVVSGVIREDLHAALRTRRGQALERLFVTSIAADAGPLDGRGLAYFADVEAKARTLPGVTSAAWIHVLPAGRTSTQTFAVEPPIEDWRELRLDVETFSPKGKPLAELRTVAGRLFGGRDAPGSCPAAMINEAAAARDFTSPASAVGRSLEDSTGARWQIVGVLADPPAHHNTRATLYVYDEQSPLAHALTDQVFQGPVLPKETSVVTMTTNVVSPAYFDVFADPVIEGAPFTSSQNDASCRVAVVSARAAAAFGPDALQGTAHGALIDERGERLNIIGVVADEPLGASRVPPAPSVFVPIAQAYSDVMTLALRAADSSPGAARDIDSALRRVPGGRLLTPVITFEQHLQRTSLAAARIATALIMLCAALAMAMSAAGVYAVMSDLVARRSRELALRMALGAGAWDVISNIVREGLRLGAIGGSAGFGLATAGTPLIDRFVFRPHLPGLVVLLVTTVALGILVAAACAVPAWRAVSVDPRRVMHDE